MAGLSYWCCPAACLRRRLDCIDRRGRGGHFRDLTELWTLRIGSDRSSVLCPANAGRYFAAVAGSSDIVLESIADDEFVGITTEIPAMKKRSAPPARGRINPKLRSQAFNKAPIGMSFSLAWAKGGCLGADPSLGKIGLQIEIDRDADHATLSS